MFFFSRDKHSQNLLSAQGVTHAFANYVCIGAPPGKREWSEAQREEIQLHALAALAEIAPILPADVIACRLPTRMLLMLDWAADQSTASQYEGSGNSFYGAGGYKSKRAQLRYCCRLLLASISDINFGGIAIIEELVEQGAIEAIIRVLNTVLAQQKAAYEEDVSNSGGSDEAIAVEIISDLLLTLSLICSSGSIVAATHNRELFGSEGSAILCEILRNTPSRLSSGLGHARLLLSALDCLWSAGVGSDMTEDALLENGSIFALLDLIQLMHDGLPSPVEKDTHDQVAAEAAALSNLANGQHVPLQAIAEVATGCLIDLLDNPRSIRHLLAWRGSQGISAPHLFCEMWRRERRSLFPDGTYGHLETPESIISSRIYAIFIRLGWTDVPGLTAEDHVTRPEIDHYLDDLTCYTWEVVIAEIDREGIINPTEEDAKMLQLIGMIAKDKRSLVGAEQEDAKLASQQALLTEEAQFYEQLSVNQQLRQRAFDRYEDLISRTSRHNALTVAKERQLLAVDASRVRDPRFVPMFHQTGDIPNIGTTTFGGRHVAIDSEPCRITGGRLAAFNLSQAQLQKSLPERSIAATLVPAVSGTGFKDNKSTVNGSTTSIPNALGSNKGKSVKDDSSSSISGKPPLRKDKTKTLDKPQ